MKSIRDVGSERLTWKGANDTYELRSGADLVGTLTRLKGVSLYLGEAADGRWTFKRTGIFCTRVTVRVADSTTDLVTVPVALSGGSLDFGDGRKYLWAGKPGDWSLKGAAGETLLQLTSKGANSRSLSGEITLTPAGLALPEASLVVLFCWYLLVLRVKQAEADAEAAAVMMVAAAAI